MSTHHVARSTSNVSLNTLSSGTKRRYKVLALYRRLLRVSGKLPDLNSRVYFTDKIQSAFKEKRDRVGVLAERDVYNGRVLLRQLTASTSPSNVKALNRLLEWTYGRRGIQKHRLLQVFQSHLSSLPKPPPILRNDPTSRPQPLLPSNSPLRALLFSPHGTTVTSARTLLKENLPLPPDDPSKEGKSEALSDGKRELRKVESYLPPRADPSSDEYRLLGPLSKRRENNIRRKWWHSLWDKIKPPLGLDVEVPPVVTDSDGSSRSDEESEGPEEREANRFVDSVLSSVSEQLNEQQKVEILSSFGIPRSALEGSKVIDELERLAGKEAVDLEFSRDTRRRKDAIPRRWKMESQEAKTTSDRDAEATARPSNETNPIFLQSAAALPPRDSLIKIPGSNPNSNPLLKNLSRFRATKLASAPSLPIVPTPGFKPRYMRRQYAFLLSDIPILTFIPDHPPSPSSSSSSSSSTPPAGKWTVRVSKWARAKEGQRSGSEEETVDDEDSRWIPTDGIVGVKESRRRKAKG